MNAVEPEDHILEAAEHLAHAARILSDAGHLAFGIHYRIRFDVCATQEDVRVEQIVAEQLESKCQ